MIFWLNVYSLIWFGFMAAAILLRWKQIFHPEKSADPLSYGQPFTGRTLLLHLAWVTMAWPITLPILVWTVVADRLQENYEPPVEKISAPSSDDLQAQLTIEEIERAEIVSDPLHAAPEIPFGHLNAAWLAFRHDLHPGVTFWAYKSRWANNWGRLEDHEGYAAVSDGEIVRFFETAIVYAET